MNAIAPPATDRLSIPASLEFIAPAAVDTLVRVGGAYDGGYVIPPWMIAETDVLVSLGVSDNWSFDEHFKRLNPALRIDAYDYSVSRRGFVRRVAMGVAKWLLGQASLGEVARRVRLLKAYNRFFSGDVRHFEERIHNRVDLPYDVTLGTVFARTDSRRIFLKVDIEGSEYRIVDDILAHADRVVGMVIEFHDTEPLRPVFEAAVRKLQERFEIVHLHANNFGGVARDGLPEVLEITFAHESRQRLARRRELPIPSIDAPNNPHRRDYALAFVTPPSPPSP